MSEDTERFFKAIPEILEVLILSDECREMYLGFWRSAQSERYGFRIEVVPHDTDLLINSLLQVRAEHGGFEDVSLFATCDPGVVFLVKNNRRRKH